LTPIVAFNTPLAAEARADHSLRIGVLAAGTPVDVKNRYIRSWSSGFEVAALVESGYLIRRMSDQSILPDVLGFDEVRRG
jgi:hypothetical protein